VECFCRGQTSCSEKRLPQFHLVHHAPPSSAEVKNEWSYPVVPPCAFIAWTRAAVPVLKPPVTSAFYQVFENMKSGAAERRQNATYVQGHLLHATHRNDCSLVSSCFVFCCQQIHFLAFGLTEVTWFKCNGQVVRQLLAVSG
jgi:hypothetical protein